MRAMIAFAFLGTLLVAYAPARPPEGEKSHGSVLELLGQSKLTLADGIRQAAKSPGAAISAKFELDHSGELSLSVYTAAMGLAAGAEQNVLKELSGSPESAPWKPKTEVFEDVPHVSRAAQQLTLMTLSPFSLLDILERAQKKHPGAIYSITPVLRGRKALFVVLVSSEGKSVELDFDLTTGEAVGPPGR